MAYSLSLFVVGCFCFSLSRFDFISYDMTCVLPMSWKFSQILGPAVFVLWATGMRRLLYWLFFVLEWFVKSWLDSFILWNKL